jgi:hypothetical protein
VGWCSCRSAAAAAGPRFGASPSPPPVSGCLMRPTAVLGCAAAAVYTLSCRLRPSAGTAVCRCSRSRPRRHSRSACAGPTAAQAASVPRLCSSSMPGQHPRAPRTAPVPVTRTVSTNTHHPGHAKRHSRRPVPAQPRPESYGCFASSLYQLPPVVPLAELFLFVPSGSPHEHSLHAVSTLHQVKFRERHENAGAAPLPSHPLPIHPPRVSKLVETLLPASALC